MREHYIDNIRWVIIILVVIHHVVCIFNSTGVLVNFNAPGIPVLDVFAYFVYPWFMPCMFLIGGMSARYSLNKRTNKQFLIERVNKLLIPFLISMLIIAPFVGIFTFNVNGWSGIASLPKVIIGLILMASGMGPLWFLIEMFIISMIFLLVKSLDRRDKLLILGGKANIWILLFLYIPCLGFAQIFNFMYTFRNGLFIILFLLGYFVFSHDKVQEELEKHNVILLVAAAILFIIEIQRFWGKNFSDLTVINNYLVFLYGWIMMLAVIGNFKAYFNYSNRFTKYISSRSFLIYIFHYLPMNIIAYYIVTYLKLPIILNYILVLILSFAVTTIISEVVYRIPGIRFLFGIRRK
ncbi:MULTISPECIES: acyltransferase family protein [unclassified Clostridium]|uniref:acyltransferase family protein n=1 Tax=unclassified Clostridium TaxID=2614128 RepID=UPI000297A6E4|nr:MULTISPECIES: acyltransferase family protein [unclassified Clostridium]EKQ55500.1 MAG: acetyltransferase, fucose-4-O-acetylase [Clostridium sp. Maddingley MBC34-26]